MVLGSCVIQLSNMCEVEEHFSVCILSGEDIQNYISNFKLKYEHSQKSNVLLDRANS